MASALTDIASVLGPILPWFFVVVAGLAIVVALRIERAEVAGVAAGGEPPKTKGLCQTLLVLIGSLFGAGVLLVTVGLGVTAIVAAMVTAIVLLLFIQVLEREGERRLPWSDGKPALEPRAGKSLAGVFKGLNKVLWTRVSLILMLDPEPDRGQAAERLFGAQDLGSLEGT